MYFWIIAFGFLLAVRGARPSPLQKPLEGLKQISHENKDLFFTMGLILALWAFASEFEMSQGSVRGNAILTTGLAAYLLSRYQKKGEVFFLSAFTGAFMISQKQSDLFQGLIWAGAVSSGIVLFQAGFLGLRHRLLFSRVPSSMKGWPALCLLAGAISIALGGLARWAF
jgi:hypothetical protein